MFAYNAGWLAIRAGCADYGQWSTVIMHSGQATLISTRQLQLTLNNAD